MPQYPRYATYFVPSADSALYGFGASLLGYDAYTGEPLPFPQNIETEIDGWKLLSADPRKYGFHATLKAPISLAAGRTETHLAAAIETFARAPRAIPRIAPEVHSIGSFIAIVPDAPCPELQHLASACVTVFDDFRAPLTAEDRARRNVASLTDTQVTHLERWGYPYVFEDFRFHMTLTGSLPPERRPSILDIMQRRFAALELQSVPVDRLALLRQNNPASTFQIIAHWSLTAATASVPVEPEQRL